VLVGLKARRREQARDKLASHGAWPSDLIFTTKHGTPIEPRNLARSLERLCRAAEVPVIRLHDTRHPCASLLAKLGVSPRTIMAILGHSQIAVTMNVYTHVTTEEQRQAVVLLDKLLTTEDGSSVGR
jgi:integrase